MKERRCKADDSRNASVPQVRQQISAAVPHRAPTVVVSEIFRGMLALQLPRKTQD